MPPCSQVKEWVQDKAEIIINFAFNSYPLPSGLNW